MNGEAEDWLFQGTQAQKTKPSEDDLRIEALFGRGEGAWFLTWLRQRTIEQPAWVPGLDASHGFAREGQNSLVRDIERRIALVRGANT